jgi:serine/threonine protein phosphatase PrpC
MSSGSIKFNPALPCLVSGYAGATMGAKKKQDRHLILPELNEGVFYLGVFDGHAEEGAVIAERATRAIPEKLAAAFKDSLKPGGHSLAEFGAIVSPIFVEAYLEFQATLAEEYDIEVTRPVEEMRLQMEKEHGVEIPRSLPMKGGTTATTAIIAADMLAVAWVGDSRAVLCCLSDAGTVSAYDLTTDHNVVCTLTLLHLCAAI